MRPDVERAAMGIVLILTTALDLEEEDGLTSLPQSPIYMGLVERLNFDLHMWTAVLRTLQGAGLITTTSETLSLTPAGKARARELERVLEAHNN